MADRNFDDLVDKMSKNIYGSVKGGIRLNLVWEDIETHILSGREEDSPLDVLDAGGGFGQISLRLAERGHGVVLCDASKNMLEKTEELLSGQGGRERITLVHSRFQELPESWQGRFDVIMMHAVLEWLENPGASLKHLLTYLKPGGCLSLMYYNLDSLIFKNAIKGNFRKIMAEDFKGTRGGLTPINPIAPGDVADWLQVSSVQQVAKTGIRVFYDYMYRQMRQERTFEDILTLERMLCRKEPYASMGCYIHLVGRKDR